MFIFEKYPYIDIRQWSESEISVVHQTKYINEYFNYFLINYVMNK